jgi:cation:H+ antiporter
MTLDLVLFVVALLMLYFGAHWLVKGSSSLARSLGLSPLIIGLTVVAFGTSAPELVISVVSSFEHKSMIAVGNVVGSNICNIALVLGLTAVINPIRSQEAAFQRDMPVMLGISLYLLLISFNSTIGRLEGATLFGGIILYTLWNYSLAVKESEVGVGPGRIGYDTDISKIGHIASRTMQVLLIVAGIIGVVAGAEILIDTAVSIMKVFGVGEKFIGLTVVALGTSLPELATSVMAAMRKEMDISMGNLLGSNIFNMLSVLGAASLVRPIEIPGGFVQSGLLYDYLVMMGISFLPWLMARKTCTVSRRHGLILLFCYGGYVAYLILKP